MNQAIFAWTLKSFWGERFDLRWKFFKSFSYQIECIFSCRKIKISWRSTLLTVHRWRLPDSSLWVHGPSEATYISPIGCQREKWTRMFVKSLHSFHKSNLIHHSTYFIFPYHNGHIPDVSVNIRTHGKNISETSINFTTAWLISTMFVWSILLLSLWPSKEQQFRVDNLLYCQAPTYTRAVPIAPTTPSIKKFYLGE